MKFQCEIKLFLWHQKVVHWRFFSHLTIFFHSFIENFWVILSKMTSVNCTLRELYHHYGLLYQECFRSLFYMHMYMQNFFFNNISSIISSKNICSAWKLQTTVSAMKILGLESMLRRKKVGIERYKLCSQILKICKQTMIVEDFSGNNFCVFPMDNNSVRQWHFCRSLLPDEGGVTNYDV